MYQVSMSYFNLASIILAAAIILLSLAPSPGRHRAALICYTIMASGFASILIPAIFISIKGIGTLGSGQLSPLIYIIPVLTLVYYLLPTYYLWVHSNHSRIIALVIFGIVIMISFAQALQHFIKWKQTVDLGYRFQSMLFLLLWLRIHDMRVNLTQPAPK